MSNVEARSLFPDKVPQTISDCDSEDELHEMSSMALAMKHKVSINPRALSAALP